MEPVTKPDHVHKRRGFLALGFLASLGLILKKRLGQTAPGTDEYVQVLNAQGELVEIPKALLNKPNKTKVRSHTDLKQWLDNQRKA